MEMKEFFLAQLQREQAANRKALAEVPEGKPEYKPHEKSMPLGYLSSLVAQMPAWIAMMLTTDSLDLADKSASGNFQREAPATNADLLKLAEESYAKGKAALESATDEKLDGIWTLRMGDKTLSSGTRRDQIADTFTHLAHHRGQLTVYLRLNGAKVPAIYGPSAEEH